MTPKLKFLIGALTSFALLILLTPAVQAQNSILPTCVSDGYCTLCDIMQLVINFGKFLLGIVGSLALLMFVYGGFTWLTSGGESGKIDAGKKILINSVIGVAITFFAWIVVTFIVATLTTQSGATFNGKKFADAWQGTLNCEPLPGLEPVDLEDRWGPDVGGPQKAVGDSCAKSTECGRDLFCNDLKKCQTKMGEDEICTYKTIESKECKETFGCTLSLAIILANDACQSGTCGYVTGKCTAPSAGQGIKKEGEICSQNNECGTKTIGGGNFKLYCHKTAGTSPLTGKCTKVSDIGQSCDADMVLGGSADDMCNAPLAQCDRDFCVPTANFGRLGMICTASYQCQNPAAVSCACEGAATAREIGPSPNCRIGICTPKIPAGDFQIFCDEWSVYGDDDNTRCTLPHKCNDGVLGGLGTKKCTR